MIARTSRPPPDRARQRFALLTASLGDEHEQSVVRGSLAAARELDARLVVVAGGPVDSPDERLGAGNFAFDLVGRDNALGILVLSSTLGNAAGPERLAAWLTRYAGLPLCCMGVPIPGIVSVRVDNATGITEAVAHLVKVHAKQNIGFIRGPIQSSRTLFLLPITLSDEALGVAAFSVTAQLARSELLEDLRELLATVLKVAQFRHG